MPLSFFQQRNNGHASAASRDNLDAERNQRHSGAEPRSQSQALSNGRNASAAGGDNFYVAHDQQHNAAEPRSQRPAQQLVRSAPRNFSELLQNIPISGVDHNSLCVRALVDKQNWNAFCDDLPELLDLPNENGIRLAQDLCTAVNGPIDKDVDLLASYCDCSSAEAVAVCVGIKAYWAIKGKICVIYAQSGLVVAEPSREFSESLRSVQESALKHYEKDVLSRLAREDMRQGNHGQAHAGSMSRRPKELKGDTPPVSLQVDSQEEEENKHHRRNYACQDVNTSDKSVGGEQTYVSRRTSSWFG